jgi:DNA-binding MarR family transcriptional regulator
MSEDLTLEATLELLAMLPLLGRIVASEVRREAGEDTTMPQFRVLAHLANGPLTLSGLAKRRRVSLQSMSELAQLLVERGWIVRTPDPKDRRQSLLQLTEHGRAHYEHASDQATQRLKPLMARLRPDELAAVRMALPALRRVLTQEEEDASDQR